MTPAEPAGQPDWAGELDLSEAERLFRMLPNDPYPGGLAGCSRLLLDEVDRLRAALDRQEAVVAAARALVERWESDACVYQRPLTRRYGPAVAAAIDVLAREVHALDGEQE